MDLLIAATALAAGLPVTRNPAGFDGLTHLIDVVVVGR